MDKGKFALLTFNNVYAEIDPPMPLRLSDGSWAMPCIPDVNLDAWREWLGSLWIERLKQANLVILIEESSNNPEILDHVHQRLEHRLDLLFQLAHLRSGIECESADLLHGSSKQGIPDVREPAQLPTFYQSKGYRRVPITMSWLEDTVVLRAGLIEMEANNPQFGRVLRGLNTLLKGLKEETGQNRLRQFVRSLEALILPSAGRTKKQFVHRCQTFAKAGNDSLRVLTEAFDMRSDCEHLNDWNNAVKGHPESQRENVCWQRTRQIEHLACDAYLRLLRDAELRRHFQADASIAEFWKLLDNRRQSSWGDPLDIATESLVEEYDQWNRAADQLP